MTTRGDDLEDDYAPDGLVADSDLDDGESFAPLEGEEDQFIVDDDGAHVNGNDATTISPSSKPVKNGNIERSTTAAIDDEAKKDKKRKKRAKDNERKAKVRERKGLTNYYMFQISIPFF